MTRTCIALLLLTGSLAWAQSPTGAVSGPVLGYLWDSDSRGLRPIFGVPGASLLGDPLALERSVSLAEVSPGQDFALAVDAESGAVSVLDLSSNSGLKPVSGTQVGPDRIVFSPTGTSAALYRRDNHLVQILSGLPQTPVQIGVLNLAPLPGLLTGLAVSDDGRLLLAAVSQGDSGAIFLVTAEGPRQIAPIGRATGLSFQANSGDALVADVDRNEIVMIRDVSGAAETRVLAGERDGVSRPVAVVSSSGRILAANAGSRTIVLLDPSGGATTRLSCDCNVSELARLRGEAFRLTAAAERPQYVIDAGSANPRVLFVPGSAGVTPGVSSTPVRAPRGRGR